MDITKAPEKGIMYAVYRDQIKYEPYTLAQLDTSALQTDNLLELHLFDDATEYRYIKTRSKGDQEYLINDKEIPHEDTYVEEVFLSGKDADKAEHLHDTVKVVNYVAYDENDLLKITGYRLQEVK